MTCRCRESASAPTRLRRGARSDAPRRSRALRRSRWYRHPTPRRRRGPPHLDRRRPPAGHGGSPTLRPSSSPCCSPASPNSGCTSWASCGGWPPTWAFSRCCCSPGRSCSRAAGLADCSAVADAGGSASAGARGGPVGGCRSVDVLGAVGCRASSAAAAGRDPHRGPVPAGRLPVVRAYSAGSAGAVRRAAVPRVVPWAARGAVDFSVGSAGQVVAEVARRAAAPGVAFSAGSVGPVGGVAVHRAPVPVVVGCSVAFVGAVPGRPGCRPVAGVACSVADQVAAAAAVAVGWGRAARAAVVAVASVAVWAASSVAGRRRVVAALQPVEPRAARPVGVGSADSYATCATQPACARPRRQRHRHLGLRLPPRAGRGTSHRWRHRLLQIVRDHGSPRPPYPFPSQHRPEGAHRP